MKPSFDWIDCIKWESTGAQAIQQNRTMSINASYDVLAFNAFYQKDIISSVGSEIGMGKESQVFLAMDKENVKRAIKIHRLGAPSFKNVRKLRNYVQNRKHISWLYVNRLSAESEFEGLSRVYALNLNTPKPVAQNRNSLVMQLFEGPTFEFI